MADTNISLDKAVNDAVTDGTATETTGAENEAEGTAKGAEENQEGDKDPDGEGNDSPEVEDEDGEEEADEDGLSAVDLTNAKNLFKALKNPEQAQHVIRTLAQQAGLLKNQADVGEAKDVIQDVLAAELGDEFKFLVPKLGPAIKKILELQKQETQQLFRQQADRQAQMQLATEVDSTLARLAKETKGESNKLKPRMLELMDEIKMVPGASTDKYLRRIYTLANSENAAKAEKRKLAAKINQNANDAASRLSSGGVKGGGGQDKSQGKMTLDQSIAFALESIGVK